MKDAAVFREVIHNADRIIARLAASGIEDVCDGDLLIIAGKSKGTDTRVLVELLSELPAGPAYPQLVEGLVSKGYMSARSHPDGRTRIIPTERGQSINHAIREQLRISRWIDFPMRPDDIVISTYPKSGTTWLQMICALVIFQTAELPAPLQDLSPWMDRLGDDSDDVFARLAAQQHRRFIKTHLRLGEIPIKAGVTYLVPARNPLDAMLSYFQMVRNVKSSSGRAQAPMPPAPEAPSQEMVRDWLSADASSGSDFTLASIMQHLTDAWDRRTEPNVLLVHYEALSADLETEMRRLAARLGIAVPEARWPSLVNAATFRQMRAAADRLQPNGRLADPATFFSSGKSWQGAKVLPGELLAEYQERMTRLAPPDLLAWLHRDGLVSR